MNIAQSAPLCFLGDSLDRVQLSSQHPKLRERGGSVLQFFVQRIMQILLSGTENTVMVFICPHGIPKLDLF